MVLSHRQQLAPESNHEDDAEREDGQTDGREVEQRERFQLPFGQHLGGEDIGRGAHQGGRAAENGSESQRHEQA